MANLTLADIEKKRGETETAINALITELENYCEGCSIHVADNYVSIGTGKGYRVRSNNIKLFVQVGGE